MREMNELVTIKECARTTDKVAWNRDEFHRQLLAKHCSYHLEHPFQRMMTGGELSREQMQGWVANRYYYQTMIPRKDAAILANMPSPEVRRAWVGRILEHDGTKDGTGGIEAWIQLGLACGLTREEIVDERHVLPGVRFAVDAYVDFARRAPWQEAVCSSLTELFAGDAHKQRLQAFPVHYKWIAPEGLQYFERRIASVRSEVDYGLRVTLEHFTTQPLQERALEILQFKMDILWSMLDAIHLYYVVEGKDSEGHYHGSI